MKSHLSLLILIIMASSLSMESVSRAAAVADRIQRLPGQPGEAGFEQFSGYITVDEVLQSRLFYYFAEAQTESASRPLVLLLGDQLECSNLGGFSGNGPFSPVSEDVLAKNRYAFNKEVNIIYLDSPAGTGFSYSANITSGRATLDDSIIAKQNLIFLRRWIDIHPEYKSRDFYICGQGYAAGRSIPFLADIILQQSPKDINMKGVMMGSPLLDFNTDMGSIGDFLWSHGLISDDTNRMMRTSCNGSRWLREIFSGSPFSAGCKAVDDQLTAEIPSLLDIQDVSSDVCLSLFPPMQMGDLNVGDSKFFQSLAASSSHKQASEGTDVCLREKMAKYLNREDVQDALHVRKTNWRICSRGRNFTYDKRNWENPTIELVGSLIMRGIRVLIYSVDEITFVPFLGTRFLVNDLANKIGLNTTVTYQGWYDCDKQVGGWTKAYGAALTYASIRGGSAKVAKRSLSLLKSFIARKPLTG
ncbi:Serine carboxypeptidase-like 46 [Linum perenne]